MNLPFFRGLLALFLGFIGTVLHAQETWQVRPSGITNNLWSVTYAANQWVAVGEQGTIVTLSAGLSWTRRTMGTGIDAVADANADAR